MCGIAAFSGNKNLTPEQARLATNKMKILGLFNQSRGTHGCGLYINGNIFKGIEDTANKKNTKEFDDFISNIDFIWPGLDLTLGNVMFLHTRQATAGAHTEANTHPFLIRSEDPKNNLVGVHNGTIDNIWTLCNKYDVPWLEKHIQVDSKALYTLIDKVGLDILKEYKGAAALIWTKPSDPNSMYVYHGAARKEHNDKETYEERPMWYMKSAEGLYFSSMPTSLLAIRESTKQEIKFLDYNSVIKVTNGKFTTSRVAIEREDSNLPPIVVRPVRSEQNCSVANFGANRNTLQNLLENESNGSRLRRLREQKGGKANNGLKTPETSLVWHETKPKKAINVRDEEIVYFHKGRYHRSGDKLCNNLLYIKDRGVISDDSEKDAKPFWFYQGVMMKDVHAYEACIAESKVNGSWANSLDSNFAYAISRFSMFPVTNMDSEAIDKDDYFRFSWYFNERRISTKITPKFTGRCYNIVEGFLVDISASNPDDKKTLDLPLLVSDAELFGATELGLEGIPPHSAVPTLIGACGQNLLPVRTDQTSVSSRKNRDDNGSPFEIIFQYTEGKDKDGMEELFGTLTPVEIEAMVRFVHERMVTEWHCKPNPQEVQAELWSTIRGGIKQGVSIRQALKDENMLLEALAEIISKEREEDVQEIDSIEVMMMAHSETVDEWKKRFYDRNGYIPEGNRAVVDAESSPFPDCLDEEVPIDHALREFEEKEGTLTDLDEVFARHDKKVRIEEENYQQTGKFVDESIGGLGELCTIADELQAIDHEYAQDAAHCLYTNIGRIKHDLAGICEVHHDPEAIRRMNQEIVA